jgi:hypothetical protein
VNRQFGRNVFATIGARVVNMARGVCLVPFLLSHIGLEAYGIWTTIFILVTYVGLTTMGVSNVYIKYVAEFTAKREYDKANALLSTGLAVTIPTCAALFCLPLCWDGTGFAPWLHLPAAHASDGKEAVLIVLGVFLSSIAFNAFGDMLTGTQQIASTQVFLTISIPGRICPDRVAGQHRPRHSRAGRGISGPHGHQRRPDLVVGASHHQVAAIFRRAGCSASRSATWCTSAGWFSCRACWPSCRFPSTGSVR